MPTITKITVLQATDIRLRMTDCLRSAWRSSDVDAPQWNRDAIVRFDARFVGHIAIGHTQSLQ